MSTLNKNIKYIKYDNSLYIVIYRMWLCGEEKASPLGKNVSTNY